MGQWRREDRGEALLVEWGQERWDRVDHLLRGRMGTAGREEADMDWGGEMALVEEGGVEISVAADFHQENGGEGRGSLTVVMGGDLEVEEGGEEAVTNLLNTYFVPQMHHGISERLLAPNNSPGKDAESMILHISRTRWNADSSLPCHRRLGPTPSSSQLRCSTLPTSASTRYLRPGVSRSEIAGVSLNT